MTDDIGKITRNAYTSAKQNASQKDHGYAQFDSEIRRAKIDLNGNGVTSKYEVDFFMGMRHHGHFGLVHL